MINLRQNCKTQILLLEYLCVWGGGMFFGNIVLKGAPIAVFEAYHSLIHSPSDFCEALTCQFKF